MKSYELRKKRADLAAATEKLMADGVVVTPEIRSQVDGNLKQMEEWKETEARLEKLEKIALENATVEAREVQTPPATETRVEVREHHNPVLFKTPEERRAAYVMGRQLQAQFLREVNPGRAADAKRWLQDNSPEYRAAMSAQVASTGGSLVPDGFASKLLVQLEAYGETRAAAKKYGSMWPMTSDTLVVPRISADPTAYYVGDVDAVTESKPSTDSVTLVAKKLGVLIRIPISLIEDVPMDAAEKVADSAARSLGGAEDDAVWNGDGTSTYGGIFGFRNKAAAGTKVTAPGSANSVDNVGELTDAAACAMIGTLPQWADGPNLAWFCPRLVWGLDLCRLARAGGGATPADIQGNTFRREYAGYPVHIIQKVAAATATDLSSALWPLFFGDLGKSLIWGDKRQITVRQSDQRYFEYDQIGMLVTERFDINWVGIDSSSVPGAMIGLLGN